MSTTDSPAGTDVPQGVTLREVQEVLRTFSRSGWKAMTLEVQGLRITVGKDGPPAGVALAPAGTTAVGATAPSAAPLAPVAPPSAPQAPVPAVAAGPAQGAAASAVDTTGCVAVRSPAVGAFWTAPSPGQPPFVRVGDTVAADQQLAIVEVMKLMNPVVAATAGEVVQVCAENAAMVEYEQVLFWIRPSDG
ncbi:acetyl-CoA carboxylase biotin carboxyl carrier protein subunit [Geodermatophilus amargosae]|uniref:acetyl-CoA carboxylase biotin carboxyl carrier protein subunit n=1 Tax=Geodermatophilus amargosae TaxID=1296565 RepID=UPI0034DF2363